jgi:hypothetical protein
MPVHPENQLAARAAIGLTTIHYADVAQCLAWYGNVQIILSLAPPNRQFMRRIIDGLAALERHTRQRPAALLIIRADVAPPDDEARTYIRDELRRSTMVAAAQVVEGTGFRGATMRSVLSMIQLAVRPPFPMRVFSEIANGCAWLAGELQPYGGVAPEAAALTHAASQVRQRFAQQAIGAVDDGA